MKDELEMEVLRHIAETATDRRLHFIADHFSGEHHGHKLDRHTLTIWAWDWISRGLAYFDISQPASSNWKLCITERGRRYLDDGIGNIYNENVWHRTLIAKSDGISEVEMQYAKEAIVAFNKEMYLSCHVMIGVSSEAVIVRMASAMARCNFIEGREAIGKTLSNPRNGIRVIFDVIKPEIEKAKREIPGNLSDNIAIWFYSMYDAIRVNRNDAGHPKGANVGRDDCIMILTCFVTYMSKACKLIRHFEERADAQEVS